MDGTPPAPTQETDGAGSAQANVWKTSNYLDALSAPEAGTPNTVELISTLGALVPRGGPVQDLVHTVPQRLCVAEGYVPHTSGLAFPAVGS